MSNATLVVRMSGSLLPISNPNPPASPRDIENVTHSARCRYWSTIPANFGGAISGEVHAIVPMTLAPRFKDKLTDLHGVTSVQVERATEFAVAPDQPKGAGSATSCQASNW
jgi:hypothetical protein